MNARTEIQLGLVYGLDNEAYHATEALGASGLKKLARSPHHFYGANLDPSRPVAEPTEAMKAGTLAHCAVLEPDELKNRYILRPANLDGRTNSGKAWIKNARDLGLEIITDEQHDKAIGQADAVRKLPEIQSLLSDGMAEVSAFWIDEVTGVYCKCRPDWVFQTANGVILLDLKTTKDASPQGFPKSVWNYGYHLQAAHYIDGYQAATGQQVLGFVFAAVESDYPYAAAAYMLDDATLDKAREENRRLLSLYAECQRTGIWPGYASEIQTITLPAWAL